jgi:hypothetical protein
MKLNWECLNEDYCYRTPAPLFGSIRVERYSENNPWGVSYSIPGYSDTLIEGEWEDAESAMKAAEDHIFSECRKLLDEPEGEGWRLIEDGAPTDGTPVQVYAGCQGWNGKGVVCAAYHCNQWRIYGIINGMPKPERISVVQWLSEIQPTHWRPLPDGPEE